MKKLRDFWEGLNIDVIVNKRELALGLSFCVTAGMLLGMLLRPVWHVTIGSNNSGNGCNNNAAPGQTEHARRKGEAV